MPASLPLHEQVRARLAEMLATRYQPGDVLPTQTELAEHFNASLITIKRALAELARHGLIQSARGRGTIVTRPVVVDRHSKVSSWTEAVATLGLVPQTGWCRIALEEPEPAVRDLLGLSKRARVVAVRRLRLVQNRPVCLMTNCIPARLVPGMEEQGLEDESLYSTLENRFSLQPTRADERVTALPATPESRRHLGRDASILLRIERVSYLADGTPMEWAEVLARPDRYRYEVQLHNSPPNP